MLSMVPYTTTIMLDMDLKFDLFSIPQETLNLQENILSFSPSTSKDHPQYITLIIWAPLQENLSSGVSDKVTLKPVCSATETN